MEFILGVLAGFALSFFTEAGKDFYHIVKAKIDPPEPPPVIRDQRFSPDEIRDKDPHWVKEDRTYHFEGKGFVYYRTDKNEKAIYVSNNGVTNYLMFKPDA